MTSPKLESDTESDLRRGYLYRLLASSSDARVLAIGESSLFQDLPRNQFSNLVSASVESVLNSVLIPGEAATFDLVILHGVLENLDGQAQKILLKKCRELLKAGGVLGVAASNRIYYRRLISKLKCWVTKDSTNDKTLWGYERLLGTTGYKNLRSYNVLPNYHDPVFVISTEAKSAAVYYQHELEKYISHSGLIKNLARYLLTRLNLYRFIEHSFLLAVEKS